MEVDEIIGKLTDTMREAAAKDRELNKAGNPAIAKLKLLPRVMLEISKPHWQSQLLEGGVLECIRYIVSLLLVPPSQFKNHILIILASLYN